MNIDKLHAFKKVLQKTCGKVLAAELVLAFTACFAFAGIGVSPVVVETKARPGKTVTGTLIVLNTFSEKVLVEAQPENWAEYQKESAEPAKVESWLDIRPKKFTIKPGKMKKIKYKVRMPENAKGEMMAMIFFASLNPGKQTLSIGTRFGVAFYAAVQGTESLEGNVLDTAVARSSQNGKTGITFLANLENTGNVHFRPRGKIVIADEKDNKIDELEVQYGWPLFPGKKHLYNAFWEKVKLEKGAYHADVVFNYGDIYQDVSKEIKKSIYFEVNDAGEPAIKTEVQR